MKTDLHKKTGHTGAPRLKLGKNVREESGKDNANPYCMPPRRWFLTFMCMNTVSYTHLDVYKRQHPHTSHTCVPCAPVPCPTHSA